MVEVIELGNEGEGESRENQERTKSRTMRIRISLMDAETAGASGIRGAREFGLVKDHWERVRTACHAAGVENANGCAACPSVWPRREVASACLVRLSFL